MSASNGSISASRSGSHNGGYSAAVKLFLRLNGDEIPLSQVGGGRLYFDKLVSLPPGRAEVVIEIDGVPKSSAILIPASSEPSRVVEYSAV